MNFNPDYSLLASASWDHSVRVWKRDGTPVAKLCGHAAHVFAVQWTRDGRRILSAAADGTIRLWNPTSGQAEWQILLDDSNNYVMLDSKGRIKQGKKEVLDNEFLFFMEDDQGHLVRQNWEQIRAQISQADAE
jgi:WD40 repeat protein